MIPRVSVIIPWRDRPELEQTLAANLVFMAQWPVETLIVNYGGDAAALAGIAGAEHPMLRVIEVRVDGFNKSRALNIGIHFARGEYVLLLDADVMLADFDLALAMRHADAGAWVCLKKIAESAAVPRKAGQVAQFANRLELVLGDGRAVAVETRRTYFGENARSCPGIMFLHRKDVLGIGGFNSLLVGWGWEDIDAHVRLGLVLGRERVELGEGVHVSHGDERRYFLGGGPAENNQRNQQICMGLYNAGQFTGTYAEDTAAFAFRSLAQA